MVYGGSGHHLYYLEATDPTRLTTHLQLLFANNLLYVFVLTTTKLAILCMILRVLVERRYRMAAWATIGLVSLTWLISFTGCFWICTPVPFFWNKNIEGGWCVDQNAMYRIISLPTIFTDVLVFILPIPTLGKIHISKRQRYGLYVTFALGGM